MHMPMAEVQRRQYLQALGLPQFVVKQNLALGAVSSYRMAEVVEVMPEPKLEHVAARVVMPELKPVAVKPIAEPVPMPAAAVKTTVSFACRLFLLGNDRIALLAIPNGQDLSSAELMLWRSLCVSMAWPVEDGNARFDWPFAYAKHLASDPVAAKDALTAWWQAHCESPFQLFVLGYALSNVVPSNAIMLPSLADMLASPVRKKSAWQKLRA